MSRARPGFSVLELVLVLAIFGVVLGTVSISLSALQSRNALKDATAAVVDALRRAETQALSGYYGDRWGVHFSATATCALPAASYSIYRGAGFTTATDTIDVFEMPGSVRITEVAVGGGCDVSFSRWHGRTASAGTITLTDSVTNATSTVTVNGYGRIVGQ